MAHCPDRLGRAEGMEKRDHDDPQRLALGQARTDEERQAP